MSNKPKKTYVNAVHQHDPIEYFVDVFKDRDENQPDVLYERKELKELLLKLLTEVSKEFEASEEKQKKYVEIVALRYGLIEDEDYLTLTEIGRIYQLSKQTCQNINNLFIKRLRKSPYKELLEDFIK